MKQKGLGRGLDALFATDNIQPKAKPMSNDSISEISISKVIPNPSQPRKNFDEEALQELSDSIKALGIIQPITVKKSGEKYVIISGERRWRAAQMAGLETITSYIRQVDSLDLHAMALVENIQRQDLNPVEISICMQRLIDECDLTQDALAEKIGVKRSSISNYLRLLKLPDPIQFALKSGVITMGHAKALAGAEPKHQLTLMKQCVDKSLSVRQLEELVRSMQQQEQTNKPAPAAEEEYPDSYLRLVEQLEGYFSQNISIKRSKNGGGKITIDFQNDDEINTFISRFESRRE